MKIQVSILSSLLVTPVALVHAPAVAASSQVPVPTPAPATNQQPPPASPPPVKVVTPSPVKPTPAPGTTAPVSPNPSSPIQPTPVQPAPVAPAPVQPTPVQPAPVQPAPVLPTGAPVVPTQPSLPPSASPPVAPPPTAAPSNPPASTVVPPIVAPPTSNPPTASPTPADLVPGTATTPTTQPTTPTTNATPPTDAAVQVAPNQAPTPAPEQAPAQEEVPEGFVMEDLSEDPEALAKELQAGAVQATGDVGSVAGIVKGADGQPLIGAWIEVVGQKYTARSGVDGSFNLDLKPGTYEVRIRMDGFQPRRVGDVEVKVGDKVNLDSTLTPLPGAVQTVVVAATINKEGESGRLIERQQSRATRDIMSREEMARSGGGSTSSVARRIVGTTVVGGRYLFVRGLGHRYGNTLMDGARVPSPDPDLRTVPLDLFPTAALSAINVQKTFTPDVPGDFTGGSVQLETRDMPERLTANVQVGVGGNTETTFQKRASNDAVGFADAFGFGNIKRGLPKSLPKDLPVVRLQIDPRTNMAAYTPEQIEKMGESLYNKTRVLRTKLAPTDMRLSANIGNSWALGRESKLGFLAAGGYNNAYQTVHETIRRFSGANGKLAVDAPQTSYKSFQTIHRVQLNGLGLIKFKIANRHRLALTSLYTRDSEDESRIYQGAALSVSSDTLYSTRLRYIARSVWTNQLTGSHTFPKAKKLRLDWFGTVAKAQRDDPAMRDLLFVVPTDKTKLPTAEGSGTPPGFLYTKLNDLTSSGAANLSLPFKQWKQLDSLVKVGAWAEDKQRQFDTRRFRYSPGDRIAPGIGNILNDQTIGGGPGHTNGGLSPWFIDEKTTTQDSYRGSQSIFAGYALADLPLAWWVRINGGVRIERSLIHVRSYSPFITEADTKLKNTRLQDLDLLPAFSLVFSPRKDLNVRLSGTKTMARPELRELARFRFTDFVGGFDYFGNPNLKSTRIWNADARVEWFPSASEIVAVSLFAKSFDKPIENSIASSTGQGLMSYRNAKSALNIGAEAEFRKKLGFIHRALDVLAVGTNFAYIYSRVQLNKPIECAEGDKDCQEGKAFDQSTSRDRPLQGQSPLVVNAFIDLDLSKSGTSARLLYNTFGRRIDAISGFGLPDIYEESVHSIDLAASQSLWRIKPIYNDEGEQTNRSHQIRLTFTAMNLANSPIRKTQGKERAITYRTQRGAWFMLSLDWGF